MSQTPDFLALHMHLVGWAVTGSLVLLAVGIVLRIAWAYRQRKQSDRL